MKRFIDEDDLVRYVLRQRAPENLERDVRRWLRRQPPAPDLISRKVAAEILGVQSPNLGRLAEAGDLPQPIEVEGSSPAYVRGEIEAYAAKREKARQKKREKARA